MVDGSFIRKPIEFKEWIKLTYGNQDAFYYNNPKIFMPQIDWIVDKNGKNLVNEIIHFENFDSEFNEMLQKLGKNTTVPHINKSDRESYQKYYNQETIEIVRNWFE